MLKRFFEKQYKYLLKITEKWFQSFINVNNCKNK